MPEDVKLYDIRKRNYPNQRGDTFRSLQVFECGICGALTNRLEIGGSASYGPKAICPHSADCWHHELEETIDCLFSEKSPYEGYPDEQRKEAARLRQEKAEFITNDLAGNPDRSLKQWAHVTMTFRAGSRCQHGVNRK